jgi:hypothetical protein
MHHETRFSQKFFAPGLKYKPVPSMYASTYLDTQFLGTIYTTWVQNLLPGYKIYYRGTKFITWVQNLLPGYKIYYLGTKFITWVQHLLPGYIPIIASLIL